MDEEVQKNGSNSKVPDDYDHELEKIRLKRMQKVIDLKKRNELKKQIVTNNSEKINAVLKVLLASDAYYYLSEIKKRDENLFIRMRNSILPPSVMQQIDLLFSYLNQGMLRPGIISITDIQYIERQILGISSKITIKKRNQESKDLNSFLRNT
jgi:hypothetical protein